ncbi:MAG TPA: HXXEE domain-containing protein [Chthoniobacterales bacterium]|nr:HXXEE domain-containing protein [Chthoniobacterales bacterium]
MPLTLLAWSLTVAALIHIFEEFVFPGGFKEWWTAYRPDIRASVTDRYLVIINMVLVLFSANVALAVRSPRGNGVAAWLALAALLAENAVFHIVGAIQTRRYSPGMISGILLYIPLAIYGYIFFLRSGRASGTVALIAAAVGSSYYFISLANHKRRAAFERKKKNEV